MQALLSQLGRTSAAAFMAFALAAIAQGAVCVAGFTVAPQPPAVAQV